MKFIIDIDEEASEITGNEQEIEEEIKSLLNEGMDNVLFYTIERYKDEPTAKIYNPPDGLNHAWPTAETKDKNEDKLLKSNMMLYVNDSTQAFRCRCGSNVFSLYQEPNGSEYYECHGCYTIYRGEK